MCRRKKQTLGVRQRPPLVLKENAPAQFGGILDASR
jgi:hypothetical protein